jgi:hypothetical protein
MVASATERSRFANTVAARCRLACWSVSNVCVILFQVFQIGAEPQNFASVV